MPRLCKAFSDERARRVFLTFILTGLRRSELVGLRWEHVNLMDRTLRVVESKTEEGERLIALPHSLAAELERHYAETRYRADTDYVFAHPTKGSRLCARLVPLSSSKRHVRPLGSRAAFGSTTCGTRR